MDDQNETDGPPIVASDADVVTLYWPRMTVRLTPDEAYELAAALIVATDNDGASVISVEALN